LINSRKLDDLHPNVRVKAELFERECEDKLEIDLLIISTYRDAESQDKLYAVGRTIKGANPRPSKPMGDTVTGRRGGDSLHNYRVAFDFVPLRNGKALWNDAELFRKCGMIAESMGLEWSGRWKGKMRETGHCQYTEGYDIEWFKDGNTLAP
jgi:peptidoglycan L-alanyl-D-glutamate endopeptidase CwlK